MLTTLGDLFERHKKLEEMRQSESGSELSDRTLSDDQIDAEQDEIIATVFCLVRDGMQGLARVQTVLGKVQSIIESTYGHDEETNERLDDESGPHSAADIVQYLTEIEGVVDEAVVVLGEEFESSRPVHIIAVWDETTGHEALYKDGERVDSDFSMYASDVAKAAGDSLAHVSFVEVSFTSDDDVWPDRFEDLMQHLAKKD
jgi:hypothetical protein